MNTRLTTAECQDLVAWAVMHGLISYRRISEEDMRFIREKTCVRKKDWRLAPCGSQSEQHPKANDEPLTRSLPASPVPLPDPANGRS